MTAKRLNKLLYFSEVEYMKRYNGKPMLSENFYAWPSGPVIPSIYTNFAQFSNGEMNTVDGTYDPLTKNIIEVLDYVFNSTINIDTLDLVKMSCVKSGPWDNVFNIKDKLHEQIVEKISIYNYYLDQNLFD